MDTIHSEPLIFPSEIKQWSKDKQWDFFYNLIGKLIDRYVIVRDYVSATTTAGETTYVPFENSSLFSENQHCKRIQIEHSYSLKNGQTRVLPSTPTSNEVAHQVTDGVFSYACTVMTDGLLMLQLRDAVRQGNGPQILLCWKFMLLYFKHYNRHKYALEAFQLLMVV